MKLLKNRYVAFCAVILFVLFAGGLVAQQMGKFQAKSGGNEIWGMSGLTLRMKTGSIQDFESGAALKIAGTQVTASAAEINLIDGSTAGATVAGKAVVVGALKGTDSLWVDVFGLNSFSLRPSFRSDVSDSAMTVTLASGVPTLSFFGTDDDTWSLSMNTNDAVVFTGAGGGFLFDGSTVVSSAELNTLASVTGGTSAASKALVLGATKNTDSLTVAYLKFGTRSLVTTIVTRDNHTAGDGDSIDVAGLDYNDICLVSISRKTAAADSSIQILSWVQGIPTEGKLYIKTSAVPSDSLTYSVFAMED